VFNALDNGTISPDAGYTLATWLTNSTGGWAAEVPSLNGQFANQVVPPACVTQYVVVYPTSAVSSGDLTGNCPRTPPTSGPMAWAKVGTSSAVLYNGPCGA